MTYNTSIATTKIRKRVENTLQFIFKHTFLKRFLLYQSFPNYKWKTFLTPSFHHYDTPSLHTVVRNGIKFQVDISEQNGWRVYFNVFKPGTYHFFSKIQPHYTIVDVGANIGFYTLNLAKLAHQGTVIAFEPFQESFIKLTHNVHANAYKNILLQQKSLGSYEGKSSIEIRDSRNLGMNRIQKNNLIDSEIEMTTLDVFVDSLAFSKIDAIKVDIEGYEMEFLKGATHTIQRNKPILFLELNDEQLQHFGSSAVEVVSYLWELGYKKIQHADTGIPIKDCVLTQCFMDIIAEF